MAVQSCMGIAGVCCSHTHTHGLPFVSSLLGFHIIYILLYLGLDPIVSIVDYTRS